MRNELDFGIMDYPLNPRFFVCSPIGKDSMTAVCAQDYPVKESITMEELCEHPLLLREKGSGSRNMAEGFMENGNSDDFQVYCRTFYGEPQVERNKNSGDTAGKRVLFCSSQK